MVLNTRFPKNVRAHLYMVGMRYGDPALPLEQGWNVLYCLFIGFFMAEMKGKCPTTALSLWLEW